MRLQIPSTQNKPNQKKIKMQKHEHVDFHVVTKSKATTTKQVPTNISEAISQTTSSALNTTTNGAGTKSFFELTSFSTLNEFLPVATAAIVNSSSSSFKNHEVAAQTNVIDDALHNDDAIDKQTDKNLKKSQLKKQDNIDLTDSTSNIAVSAADDTTLNAAPLISMNDDDNDNKLAIANSKFNDEDENSSSYLYYYEPCYKLTNLYSYANPLNYEGMKDSSSFRLCNSSLFHIII